MSDIETYQDPVIAKYAALVREGMPDVFREIYQGEPIRLLHDAIPALIIAKTGTRIGHHSNEQDEHEIGITMTVVTDIRDEIGDDKELTPGIAQLYELIEARDSEYKLKPGCLLHILRSNDKVDVANNLRTDLGSITTSDFRLVVGKRSEESFSTEGEVRFIANFIQLRSY